MTMKVIKRRMASVSSTQQIMKAMNLVAASKLQKEKARLEAARPLFNKTQSIMNNMKNREDLADNAFIKPREVKNTAYIIITSDRGLCGGYNINLAKAAMKSINAGKNELIIAVGVRGWEYFRRRGKRIHRGYAGISETAFIEDAEEIGTLLVSLYTSGEVDEAYLAYTHFDSIMSHVPRVIKILPVASDSGAACGSKMTEYEPSADIFLGYATPMYINILIYGAMLESATCEQAARMISMDSATNNADEIIEDLTLMYNRIRQGSITQEISEIINGANTQQ